MTPIRAVLYDLDGTLIETQDQHARVESAVLARYGVTLAPAALTARYSGYIDRVLFRDALSREGKASDEAVVNQLIEQKWRDMDVLLAVEGIRRIPGATGLLEFVAARKLATSIASGSPLHFLERAVKAADLAAFIPVLTSSHEVRNGKPAPDVFLLAAERVGVPPAECLVIEDAFSGVKGAAAAGMRSLALWPSEAECPATLRLPSFENVDWAATFERLEASPLPR